MLSKSSMKTVNLLFLIVLLLQVSNAFLLWLPQYVRLSLNQLLFILFPAYLYLRITRQPMLERVRWSWPGWKIGLVSLLIGMGLYPLSAISAGVLQIILGYTQFTPADAIPTTILMGMLAIFAYAILAPVCEEFLFRGVIQPAYEQFSPKWGVLFVGLLFIIFHLSLLQGLSIVLLALVLGFVNYRTQSLQASILTHFGANILAALVITSSIFNTAIEQVLFSAPVLIASPLIALVALVFLIRSTQQKPVTQAAAAPQPTGRPLTWVRSWPLLVAGVIYLVVVSLEVVSARELLTVEPLRVNAAHWVEPQNWQFEIRNAANDLVGNGECSLVPTEGILDLTCTSLVAAYNLTIGNSHWSHAGGERTDRIRWSAADGRLISGMTGLNLSEGEYRFDVEWEVDSNGREIHVRVAREQDQTLRVPDVATAEDLMLVTDYSAPWQLAAMQLEPGMRGQVLHFSPYTWRSATQDNGPLVEILVATITGRENLMSPAGTFNTWKISLPNNRGIWLEPGDSPYPIQFDLVETWSLR